MNLQAMAGLLVLAFASALGLPAVTAERPPNLLLIYSDDHGWADLGAQGADPDVRTPHLDQLAREGVRFTRGYVTAPQCTPSRAAVMTGCYQNRFGVEHNGIALRADAVTLPERLRQAGYVTGMSGKWHLDVEHIARQQPRQVRQYPELAPWHQGFDEFFEGSQRTYRASHGLDGIPFADAPHTVGDDRCRVIVQTEAALAFLDRRRAQPDQPWFFYLAYMAPHVPLESPEPWFSRTPAHLPLARRQALALLGAIDDGLGRIRAKIRDLGQEEHTLIFFIGDNGAPLGSAWDGSLNTPLRGQKGMLSEGGIRVPFVAAWPGKIPAGQVFDHPVSSLDVAATALAQTSLPHDAALEGVNLLPHLTGQTARPPHETLYWRWMAQAAIQEFPHKLIVLGGQQRLLFDITTPEGEDFARNLADQRPDLAARLESKLRAWANELDPPGLPGTLADRHVQLFREHGLSAKADPKAAQQPAPDGSIQGWICRNGTLAIRDGALEITPDAARRRTFLTRADLDLVGPVQVTLRLRAQAGGKSAMTWRTPVASFTPAQSASFDWPACPNWQTVTVELPEQTKILHVRILLPEGAQKVELQSVAFRDSRGQTAAYSFSPAP